MPQRNSVPNLPNENRGYWATGYEYLPTCCPVAVFSFKMYLFFINTIISYNKTFLFLQKLRFSISKQIVVLLNRNVPRRLAECLKAVKSDLPVYYRSLLIDFLWDSTFFNDFGALNIFIFPIFWGPWGLRLRHTRKSNVLFQYTIIRLCLKYNVKIIFCGIL